MSFLAPLFLVGALAIAGPIIFHLIRRTVKERIRFSTLMFLKPSPPRLTKRSHLEDLILLLLRCAVVCLLAVSFARPYFQRAVTEPSKAANGKRIVILIDTSASLRRQGLWDASKRAAQAAIQKADAGDAIALVSFDSAPHTLLSFEQWKNVPSNERVATALSRIDTVTPSWHATHLGKALLGAADLLLDSARGDAEGANRSQIILISDLQQGAKLDGLQGYEWPRGMEVVLQPIGSAQLANAGVQILPGAAGEGLSITNAALRARVVNSPGARAEQFKLGWTAPNAATFTGTPIELHVPGGQNRSIALPALPTNVTAMSLLLTGDPETFDNRVYHAAPPRQAFNVVYIGRDNPDDPNGQLFYLRRAFPETASFAVRILTRQPGTNAPLDASLVIASTLDPADIPLLKNHVHAGKTLFYVPAESADVSPLATITDSAAPASTEAGGKYVLFSEINFEHPLFSQFRDARFNDFTKIHFWKHRRLDMTALPKARTLASFDDGSPALVQLPVQRGAVYILASGWAPADSQLALSTKFVPFLYSLLEQTAPQAAHTLQLTVGDPIPFPPDVEAASITLTKPDNTTTQWKKGEPFTATDTPGFYTSTQPPLTFAINLDPSESRTAPIPEEQLTSLGLPLKIEAPKIAAATQKKNEQLLLATEQENRQKLWRRLLIGALALLLIETLAAAIASKKPALATA
jgi:hypothetical protein